MGHTDPVDQVDLVVLEGQEGLADQEDLVVLVSQEDHSCQVL